MHSKANLQLTGAEASALIVLMAHCSTSARSERRNNASRACKRLLLRRCRQEM